MSVEALLAEVDFWNAIVTVDGDGLVLDVPEDFPDDLVQRVQEQKREVMDSVRSSSIGWLKKRYKRIYPEEGTGPGEITEIERLVGEKSISLTWSDVLQDFVAFYRTEADRPKIPPGFVAYSDAELCCLFGLEQPDVSASTLQLIHVTKKMGMRITGSFTDTEAATRR